MEKQSLQFGAAKRTPGEIVLDRLARPDKWYLGGGGGACFAPCFPRHLDRLGFWDAAHLADIQLDRLFTVFLVEDGAKRPIDLSPSGETCWTPAQLTRHSLEAGGVWRVREDKVVTSRNTFASRITIENSTARRRRLHLLVWSLQEKKELVEKGRCATVADPRRSGERLVYSHVAQGAKGREAVAVALGTSVPVDAVCLHLAEKTETLPLWDLSIFPEKFRNGVIKSESKVDVGWDQSGLLHLGIHFHCDFEPHESRQITIGANASFDPGKSLRALEQDFTSDVAAESRQDWAAYFESVPAFSCSDPYLETAYWYRWYGLRLSTVNVATDAYPAPTVFEGVGMFRCDISYSAPCHIRETAWMHDASLARGCLASFIANQRPDGSFPGHLWSVHDDPGAFYHADWGTALNTVHALHPDSAFLLAAYESFCRYTRYFGRERDPEESGLYDVVNQNETGQEYMSRYLFADKEADDWRQIRLKGVDSTVYIYVLLLALSGAARLLGRPEPEWCEWDRGASHTRDAVLKYLWDPEREFFFDISPEDLSRRSPFAAAVGLYPFLTDIPDRRHLGAVRRHLLCKDEFWTEYPVPASPLNDPYFSAEAEWRGKRTNCPWNGRSWPMATSHIADALARAARTLDPSLKPAACELILRYIRTLFWAHDPGRPNCFEHYNPITGEPSAYRGVDDYMHSTLVDLILRHVAGIQLDPFSSRLKIDPLPFGLDWFRAADIRIRGHRIDIEWNSSGLSVEVDGLRAASRPELGPLEIDL